LIFNPLLQNVNKDLIISTSGFFSQAEHLHLVNVVFSSLPTFYMCTFKLHADVIEQIDKYHKHCLCHGVDINNKTLTKVTWSVVCTPNPEGGLGVLNLRTQNEAFLLKHLHKFFNKVDTKSITLTTDSPVTL